MSNKTLRSVLRIIPEIRSTDLPATQRFYTEVFGLEAGMEEGTFIMFHSPSHPTAQLTVNDNGHPALPAGFAIDVGSAEEVTVAHAEVCRRGYPILEPLEDKPWGIRRFSVIDPGGARVTVIGHLSSGA